MNNDNPNRDDERECNSNDIEMISFIDVGPIANNNFRTSFPRKRLQVPKQTIILPREGRHGNKTFGGPFLPKRSLYSFTCGFAFLLISFTINYCSRYYLISFDPTRSVSWDISNNYSSVVTPKDLERIVETFDEDKICLRGPRDKQCVCKNPLSPESREGTRHWDRIHHVNKENALSATDDLDVVFYGDSITEAWFGTKMGYEFPKRKPIHDVFIDLFDSRQSIFTALPLGISGATSPNLAWRLENGEMPKTLNPPVFWILIGNNDFSKLWCSPEIVLIGVLNVVTYVRLHKPHAIIVINSLLPRTFNENGFLLAGQYPYRGRAGGPSLWNEIMAVNKELEQYAYKHENTYFFNATDIFVQSTVSNIQLRINQTLMDDFIHPTYIGHKLWGLKIIEMLKEIIN